jgi:hypothetical protein
MANSPFSRRHRSKRLTKGAVGNDADAHRFALILSPLLSPLQSPASLPTSRIRVGTERQSGRARRSGQAD